MVRYRHFIISIVISLFYGCSSDITPLWSFDECNGEIIDADQSATADKIFVITSSEICVLKSKTGTLLSRIQHFMPDVRAMSCDDKTCWFGGGEHQEGKLDALDLKDNVIKKIHVNTSIAQVNSISIGVHNSVVLATSDESLVLIDQAGMEKKRVVVTGGLEIYAATFSDNEIIAGNDAGEIIFWDGISGEIQKNNLNNGAIFNVFVKDEHMVVGGWEFFLVTNVKKTSESKIFHISEAAITSCDLNGDSLSVVCGLTNGSIVNANLIDGRVQSTDLNIDDIKMVKISDSTLFVASKDGSVKAWNLPDVLHP